jgi:hypothetical protein
MNDSEAREMARGLVQGSIIEDAASQFVAQVLKCAHEERIKPLRKQVEELEAKLSRAVDVLSECLERNALLEARLAEAVEALVHIEELTCDSDACVSSIARTTLAEIELVSKEGEKG